MLQFNDHGLGGPATVTYTGDRDVAPRRARLVAELFKPPSAAKPPSAERLRAENDCDPQLRGDVTAYCATVTTIVIIIINIATYRKKGDIPSACVHTKIEFRHCGLYVTPSGKKG